MIVKTDDEVILVSTTIFLHVDDDKYYSDKTTYIDILIKAIQNFTNKKYEVLFTQLN
jgi:hypothetical protein